MVVARDFLRYDHEVSMQTLREIKKEIAEVRRIRPEYPVYVYVLHKPDGTPFYVGKGGYKRIEHHEKEAKSGKDWLGKNHFKTNTIKKIWRDEGQVGYSIDSWHSTAMSANQREIELIAQYGRRVFKAGSLTNITAGGEGTLDLPPEIKAKISAKLKQMYADHPELREEISVYNKQYCLDHPEFIDNLQAKKNEWIEQKPEEYAEAEKKRLAICATEEVRNAVSETLKGYYKEHPEMLQVLSDRAARYFEENPEAIENARQNSIKNMNSEYIIRWLASVDEDAWQAKVRRHSDFMKRWHSSERGKEITKKIAAKRNELFRMESHRKHMAKKTAAYIESHPEADKARREKVRQTKQPKIQARQEALVLIQERLFAEGKIKKKVEYVSPKHLYVWKKRGFI